MVKVFFNTINLLKRRVSFYFRKALIYSYYKAGLLNLGSNVFIGKPLYITCECIKVGNGVYIWPNCRLEGITRYLNVEFEPIIVIEDNVSIQQNLHLTCARNIFIGKDTAIAANVTITDINHQYIDISIPPELQNLEITEVYIGQACKIYNNTVILPGVTLGEHTIVAANSVVTRGTYPAFCVLAGAPAKIIKRYCYSMLKWRPTDPDGSFKTE